jgi:Uncharacterized protein conserved in bacteria (DUF2213)
VAQYTYATRLSEHVAETPEGYLLCTSCVLCRSGIQKYRKSELDPQSGTNTMVDVFRPPAEVTSRKFLGSISGKALTLDHPGSLITALNHSWSARGTVLNARVGPEDEDGNVTVVGDIVIHDPSTIEQVKSGLRQLSLGYNYDLAEGQQGLEMRNLICNHCAIVAQGRAGNATIVDTVPAMPFESYADMMRRFHRVNAQDATPAPRQARDAVLSWGGGVNNERALPGGQGDERMPASAHTALAIGSISTEQPETATDEIDEENMTTTDEAESINARLERLCALLEKLVSSRSAAEDISEARPSSASLISVEALPESDRPQNPIVDALLGIKQAIADSGDEEAKVAWNNAWRAAKRFQVGPSRQLIAARDRQHVPERSFQTAVDLRRAELLSGKHPSEASEDATQPAQDRQSKPESYGERMNRAGQEMRDAKFQRS